MAAADDGLVGVVGIYVQAAAREDAGKDVARAGDALAVFTADPDCKINDCHVQFLSADGNSFTRRGRKRAKGA